MNLILQLKRDEGLRLKPYKDTVGKLTIGYGRNLDDRGISEAEADVLLANDIMEHTADLERALPWVFQLDDARKGVLVNMAFNLGIHGLLGFRKTLAFIKEGDYASAANGMRSSKWAEQVGPRAVRLARQMESGIWQ